MSVSVPNRPADIYVPFLTRRLRASPALLTDGRGSKLIFLVVVAHGDILRHILEGYNSGAVWHLLALCMGADFQVTALGQR